MHHMIKKIQRYSRAFCIWTRRTLILIGLVAKTGIRDNSLSRYICYRTSAYPVMSASHKNTATAFLYII